MSQTPALTENKSVAQRPPWQIALIQAQPKFLAISGKEDETKIEMGFASMLLEDNDKLRNCEQSSIVNAVINVARTGITLNPVLKLAHLVPRGNKCVLDFDYKGLVKILKDNNCIKDIQAIIVYSDEKFEESGSPIKKHLHEKKYAKTEAEQKKREKTGVYCTVLLPDNTVVYTPFTPAWEILKAKAVSPSASSSYSPWQKWEESMWKKTKIKSDFKMLISGSPNNKLLATLEIDNENAEVDFKNHPPQQGSTISKSTLDNIFGAEDTTVIQENEVPLSATEEMEKEAEAQKKQYTQGKKVAPEAKKDPGKLDFE